MTSERWRRIEDLYHAVLNQEPVQRDSFLAEECGDDEELRREVESLLATSKTNEGILDSPAWYGAASLLDEPVASTPRVAGQQLGQYEILAFLGRGGMGEVYRALDRKLNREVALKILPEMVARQPDRIERLKREARILATLNHPTIAAVYDLQEVDGNCFLAMELVPGKNLSEKLGHTGLSVRNALLICRQIAESLEAAHERGIIHRDLKPGNVMVTPEGRVKLLDFGIATIRPPINYAAETATRTEFTIPGFAVGTPAYMSPEQARGETLDKRTDIWSFGCILYETLTGRRLFVRQTFSDHIAAILRDEVTLDALPESMPAGIRRLLVRCLRPNTADRLRDIGDARIEIDEALSAPPDTIPAPHMQRRSRWHTARIVLLTGVLAVAVTSWFLRPMARTADIQNMQMARLTDAIGLEESPAISPDGKSAVYIGRLGAHRQIWLRLLSGGTPLPITKDDVDHSGPRWSPDSATLIYYTYAAESGLGQQGTIWEIPALGGTPRRLTRALGPGDVSHDGRHIAFLRYRDGAIELIAAARDLSTTRIVAKLPTAVYTNIRWSPDGRRIAFIRDLDTEFFNSVMVVNAAGGEPSVLSQTSYVQSFTWLPNGSGLVVSSSQGSTMPYPPSSNLWTLPLDAGTPRQLTFDESSYESPDMSAQGNLIVSRVRNKSDIWKFPVTGAPEENARGGVRVTRQTGQLQTVTANPEETEVAFLSDTGGHANVWAAQISDGAVRQLTRESDPRFVVAVPHWSPRGDLINFVSNRNTGTSQTTLWVVTPDGGVVRDLGVMGVGVCWSGDGKWLYYQTIEKGIHMIRKVAVDGGQSQLVRENAKAPAPTQDGSGLYFSVLLSDAAVGWDFEVHFAKPQNGPSQPLGRAAGSRVPAGSINFQPVLSRDGKWLAVPLMDGATANIWALSTTGLGWRKLVDFSPRNTLITRRIAWSKDSKYIYAAVAEVDSDIVMLQGVKP